MGLVDSHDCSNCFGFGISELVNRDFFVAWRPVGAGRVLLAVFYDAGSLVDGGPSRRPRRLVVGFALIDCVRCRMLN